MGGCITPAPTGSDVGAPKISILFPDAVGVRSFETPDNAPACVTLRRTSPARVTVSASDPGGLQRVVIKALQADIDRASVTYPRVADITASYIGGDLGDLVLTFTRPSESEVRTGVVVALNVIDRPSVETGPSWVAVEAQDYAGNRSYLGPVRLLPEDQRTYCENLRVSERRRRS